MKLESTRGRRGVAMLAAAAVVAAGMVLGGAAPATAAIDPDGPAPIEQRNSSTVTADPLPTVQIDSGIVWTQEVVGNTVYAGGSFTNARPAGAAPGTSLIPRSNILAYNLTTGVITSFAPQINGQVKVIKASPDGTRIYVGGSFNNVSGQTRWNIAAFDVATGALLSTWRPAVGGSYVNAIEVTSSAVYVGGLVSAGAGVARKNLMAFSVSNGALLGWAPTADLQVDSMVLTPANNKLIVAGRFGMMNGVSQRGLAALDLSSGAILPWTVTSVVLNGVPAGTTSAGKAGIWELEADANAIYGTGWVYANKTIGNLEGLFAAEPGSGAVRWIADCHGDHYGVYSDGTNVYSTGHEHSCETMNGMPQLNPAPGNMRNATVYTAAPKGTLLRAASVNATYADWSGWPAPAVVNWYPDWITGGVNGGQAGWTATGAGDYLLIGGEQAFVNGQRSQGITRFSRNPSTGENSGPRLSDTDWVPVASSTTAGKVRVSIPANWDRDDLNLTYRLIRNGGGQPVASRSVQSTYWSQPQVVLTDTVAAGSTPNYRIVAVDGDGNTANSATVSTTVSGTAGSAYAETVMDDGASLYWRLGGTAAQGGNDLVGNNDGVVRSGVTSVSSGALASEPGPAYSFNGSSTSGFVNSTSQAAVRQQYSLELWFKTTTSNGGKLVGYGSSASGTSSSYDRHVYMHNDGKLSFGNFPGIAATVSSPASYRDGAWHHMVASQGWDGMKLYVDGELVGSRGEVTAQTYSGYWRIGGDNLSSWPNRPTSNFLNGQLDEFAVYNRVLTAQEVSEHYLMGTGVAAPTAAFTFTTDDLGVSVNGSSSSAPPGRTITSYSWNWGDGTPAGSGATATHQYANGGTFTVTLTVTDSMGLTASTSKQVTVTPPHANPTAAFTTQVDGLSVAFDGTGSTAADGATITSYDWDFGDNGSSTASQPTHVYAAAGSYDVTLTVTDSLGASDSVMQTVNVAAATVLAADEFQRTSASGWGTANTGGTWSAVSGSSVAGGVGLLSLMNSQTRATTLSGTLPSGTDARISVSIDKVANGGGAHVNLAPRKTAAGEYRAKLRYSATGVVNVGVARLVGTTETLVANRVLTGYTHTAGATLDVRVRTVSTGPSTTVQVKAWPQGQPEPVDWWVSATDSEPGLQGTGQFAITTYVSGTATNGPIGIGFDHLSVVAPN
ncbi:PKD domain-containing protein [Agromyces sp. SYSU K20354]|uniref:PKD domain-containing protein n=1 Tax=Agromyces cavernae TaxID=2898659 RepID=UPI001E430C4E|nr:PKD domain-containing protein [Agromyces cavernae]MCD2441001.1 PKD domain-containing protein [Agromyces cavernae]